jgi:hypothetical protein
VEGVWGSSRPVRRGVSKGVEDGPPALGVAPPQGVEGLGKAGPVETLGRPWIPLAIRACGVVVNGKVVKGAGEGKEVRRGQIWRG